METALSKRTGLADAPKDLDWLARNIPCQAACPAHTDIPGYLEAIARGDFEEAYRINLAENVFPAVLGRVCSRPCEKPCRHGWEGLGESVAICFSKRSAADFLKSSGPVILPPLFPPTGKTIAVVGAGVAGLAAARDLVRRGHRVTVYERHDRPGGLLRLGIPPFRLPRAIVDREIQQIEAQGVEIRCGVEIGPGLPLEHLARGHDAVIVAAGAFRPTLPSIPGADLAGVEAGLPFLTAVNERGRTTVGRRVAVIGGGFTAMDCARVALRLGAESVTVYYRRSLAEIVVTPGEREEVEHEGVPFVLQAAPVACLGSAGRVASIRFVRTKLGAPDASGRRRPVEIPGSEFDVEADHVLAATGQTPDRSWIPPGTLPENVVLAGDFAQGSSSLIEAIAHAQNVAAEVDARLMGGRRIAEGAFICDGRPHPRTRALDAIPRQTMPAIPVEQRTLAGEVETGFDAAAARTEADRCYLCHYKYEIDMGRCIYCDQCVEVKPRPACIVRVKRIETAPDGRLVGWRERDWNLGPGAPAHDYFINQADCIRCNACLEVCPVRCIDVQKVSRVRTPGGPSHPAA
jgi:NADPH-dependent glutamate synthase beta subunit-like oxidoreductase